MARTSPLKRQTGSGKPQPVRLAMRDLMDLQLVAADDREIGRVDDLEVAIDEVGIPVLTAVLCGPEALAGRVSPRLVTVIRRLFRGRFDGRIELSEVVDFGLTIRLRRPAADYPVGQSDGWIAEHILRRIPGADR